MNKKLLTGLTGIIMLLSSCKKDKLVDPAPAPVPAPVTDARKVLLKEVNESGLPSPYYHFVYDTAKFVTEIGFASRLFVYQLEYENKRVKKMKNTWNDNVMHYCYSNNRVSGIRQINERTGDRTWSYYFDYNNLGQLQTVKWFQFKSDNTDSLIYRTLLMSYHADGNLATLEDYRWDDATADLKWVKTTSYSGYDKNNNVDDFGMLKDFFGDVLFLPQVKLQKNNPATETIIGKQNDYKINYTYQYNNERLPLVKNGEMLQTRGTNAGERFRFSSQYSYY